MSKDWKSVKARANEYDKSNTWEHLDKFDNSHECEINRITIEMKIDVEVDLVDEFCSIPLEYDVESYAQKLCAEQKKKDPSTNFTYYIDYDKIDEMSGETIGYIYKEEK